jgi:hypothetical protein
VKNTIRLVLVLALLVGSLCARPTSASMLEECADPNYASCEAFYNWAAWYCYWHYNGQITTFDCEEPYEGSPCAVGFAYCSS